MRWGGGDGGERWWAESGGGGGGPTPSRGMKMKDFSRLFRGNIRKRLVSSVQDGISSKKPIIKWAPPNLSEMSPSVAFETVLSVPASPPCAQHVLKSLRTLKVPCLHLRLRELGLKADDTYTTWRQRIQHERKERRRQRKRLTTFLEKTKRGHRQWDEHWNYFKGKLGLSDKHGGTHDYELFGMYTILNSTKLHKKAKFFFLLCTNNRTVIIHHQK